MTAAAETADGTEAGSGKPGGRRKLILIAVPVLLAAIGAGLWFTGILPSMLGMGGKPAAGHGAAATGHGAAGHGAAAPAGGGHGQAAAGQAGAAGNGGAAAVAPTYLDIPEMVANLNAGPHRASYVKLRSRVELARPEDLEPAKAAMPRLLDLFQTYLREMRPEELRSSSGTYRLREALIARANIALAPIRVVDVLFIELLVQ